MLTKIKVKEKITQISVQRHSHDELFSNLQSILSPQKSAKIPVTKLRQEFQQLVCKLREIVRTNQEELDLLRYQSDKLQKEGEDMEASIRTIQSLKEYFNQLGKKVKSEQTRGQGKIVERERWEVTQNYGQSLDEQSQLIMSGNAAREAKNMASDVLSNLQNQSSRLETVREKMGSMLKSINLSGNIVNLIKRRSKQDNKLIMMLTLGLVVQIFVCVYYIKPWVRGS